MSDSPDLTTALAAALEAAGVPHVGYPDQNRIELPGELDVELDVMLGTWASLDESGKRDLITELIAEWRDEGVVLFPDQFAELMAESWAEAGHTGVPTGDGRLRLIEEGLELDLQDPYMECVTLEEPDDVTAHLRRYRTLLLGRTKALGAGLREVECCDPSAVDARRLAEALVREVHPSDVPLAAVSLGALSGRLVEDAGPATRDAGALLVRAGEDLHAAFASTRDALAGRLRDTMQLGESELGIPQVRVFGAASAAVLAMPDVLVQVLGDQVEGEPVVFALDREHIFVLGADDAEGLAETADKLTRISGVATPIKLHPLVVRDGAWAELTVPDDHPARGPLAALAVQDAILSWQRTGALVARTHGVGLGPLVTAADATTGRPSTVSIWDGASALRSAELLAIPTDTGLLVAPWSRVAGLVGDLLTAAAASGWFVASGAFPKKQMAALHKVARALQTSGPALPQRAALAARPSAPAAPRTPEPDPLGGLVGGHVDIAAPPPDTASTGPALSDEDEAERKRKKKEARRNRRG